MSRAGAIAALSLLAALAPPSSLKAAAPEAPVERIQIAPREEIAVLWVDPLAEETKPEPRRILTRLLETRTDLRATELDARLSHACQGELSCIVLGIRHEEPGACLGAPASSPRLPGKSGGARYLLLISYTPPDADRAGVIEAMLVDVDRALGYWCAADPTRASWRENAQTKILNGAVLLEPRPMPVHSDAELAQELERVLAGARVFFERTHDWGSRGSVRVRADVAGFAVRLDGRELGEIAGRRAELYDLPAGTHHLSLARAHRRNAELDVAIAPGAELDVAAELDPEEPGHALRAALTWGGVAASAAGAALIGYAIVRAGDADASACVGLSPSCGSSELVAFGAMSGGAMHFADPNPGAVKIAPLGIALLAGGAAWTASAALYGEDGEVPWLQLLGGAAIGVFAYGVSAAIGGRSAFKE